MEFTNNSHQKCFVFVVEQTTVRYAWLKKLVLALSICGSTQLTGRFVSTSSILRRRYSLQKPYKRTMDTTTKMASARNYEHDPSTYNNHLAYVVLVYPSAAGSWVS